MAEQTKPAELIPLNFLPPKEVINDQGTDFSVMFPRGDEFLHGVLGNYAAGIIGSESPLWPLHQHLNGLRKASYDNKELELHGVTILELELVHNISQSYFNLTASRDGPYEPAEALKVISTYIDNRDDRLSSHYELLINDHIVKQARVYREHQARLTSNIPLEIVLDPDGNIELPPEDESKELEVTRELTNYEVRRLKLRQQRLKFEWLSAKAIVHELARQQGVNLAEALFG